MTAASRTAPTANDCALYATATAASAFTFNTATLECSLKVSATDLATAPSESRAYVLVPNGYTLYGFGDINVAGSNLAASSSESGPWACGAICTASTTCVGFTFDVTVAVGMQNCQLKGAAPSVAVTSSTLFFPRSSALQLNPTIGTASLGYFAWSAPGGLSVSVVSGGSIQVPPTGNH